MVKRAFFGYIAVELLAVVGLVWAFGIGWALAILAGAFLLGVVLAGSQLKTQLAALGRGTDPRVALTDGALVGLGSMLVLLPGVVSTAVGTLILAPPTRGAMRPMAAALLARGAVRRFGVVPPPVFGRYGPRDYIDGDYIDGDYIDGDYIDGEVIDDGPGGQVTPNLPARY